MQTTLIEKEERIEECSVQTASDLLPLILTIISIIVFAAIGIFFWFEHPMLICPDQGLYVHMAKLFLQGKMPYVEMFDNNPPLAFYLQTIPVIVASSLHITEPLAFALYIWGLIIISSAMASIVLWRSGNRGALYVGLAAVLGSVCFAQHQVVDFGQREHIFAILYLPFLILRYLRWQGLKIDAVMAILIGTAAGIGIALKPYFLLVALAPEIVWAIEKRSIREFFRQECLFLCLAIFVYLAHFLFLPKQELDNYFGFIVPIYKAGYSFYTTSMSYNLNTWWRNDFYLMALTTLGALALARQSSLVMPLQAFSLASALIFILAGQVWSYHVLPVRLANEMALFIQTFLFGRCLLSSTGLYKKGPWLLALVIVLFTAGQGYIRCRDIIRDHDRDEMFFMPALGYDGECPAGDIDPYTQIVIDHTAKDDSILFISSSMGPGYPVYLQSGRKPASRFLHAMILPVLGSILDNPDQPNKAFFKERMEEIMRWYGEDIAKNKPKMIVIQSKFIYGMLNDRAFFKNQMADYKLMQEKDENRVYLRAN